VLKCLEGYALGDRLLNPVFRRKMAFLLDDNLDGQFFSHSPCQTLVRRAFSNLPQSCIILQKLIDIYCLNWDVDHSNYSLKTQNELPRDFLRRVTHKLHQLGKMTEEEKKQKRCYLEHATQISQQDCAALHYRWDPEKELGFFE
jgi:hypothetical protein